MTIRPHTSAHAGEALAPGRLSASGGPFKTNTARQMRDAGVAFRTI